MLKQEAIIRVENVSFVYPEQQAKAVDHVSLEVRKGEFLAVLGHNGSGKSTLAKLLNALFLPTEGKIFVNDVDTSVEGKEWDVRRTCGMVFQNPDNQLVATIVEEDVAFGLENLGVPSEEIRTRVDAALMAVGMEKYALNAPHMLSGGQKQRVAIAGVLAMKPQVIVFDEATAMLDPLGRESVFSVVTRLCREEGITVVWITHFMDEAAMADRVIVMDQGHIAMEGVPRSVFTQVNKIRSLGLDVPEMTELCLNLKKNGLKLPDGILNTQEMVVSLCQLKSKM